MKICGNSSIEDLAQETSDRCDARIALGDGVAGRRVAHIGVHRAELVDVDRLVVEAVALLLEDDRPLASVIFTAIAAPSMTGQSSASATRLKKTSKMRLATESQSAIGLSKMSSIGTWPTCE